MGCACEEGGRKVVLMRRCRPVFVLVFCVVVLISSEGGLILFDGASAANVFSDGFQPFADNNHVRVVENGQQVDLILDQQAASGFGSKYKYLFGHITMQIKLVAGNSAGTVTAYYLSSDNPDHDELDFEFLGNVSGQPYILQTNVYAHGVGNREQRINLWFDPTADFHTYGFLWNTNQIIFQVDDKPIRVYKNNADLGVPYPNSKPMALYSSLWDGSQWATQGGLIKLDWASAPFVASYRNFDGLDACTVYNNDISSCVATTSHWWEASAFQTLDNTQLDELNWVRQNYQLYDYCTDTKRYPTPPPECSTNSV